MSSRTISLIRYEMTGSVSIHPVVFHQVLDLLAAVGWQVRQRGIAAIAGAGAAWLQAHAAMYRWSIPSDQA